MINKGKEHQKENHEGESKVASMPTIDRQSEQHAITSSDLHKVNSYSVPNSFTSCIPFLHRFLKSKKEQSKKDILDTLRKIQVNIPLLDAIKQIPSYAKFLKELCTNKRRIKEHEIVALSEEVSAVLQRKLPPKLKDPGSFTIPCTIGTTRFERVLLDLGASINLMPYSVYKTLNLGELKETKVTIQLADRSLKYPRGLLEDILVSVDGLILPVDFFVLDMEDAPMPISLPLILGRPFMCTARTKIDVFEGALTMTVLGETVSFNISEARSDPVENVFLHDTKEMITSKDDSAIETVAALEATSCYEGEYVPSFVPLSISNKKHVNALDRLSQEGFKPSKGHLSTESPSTTFLCASMKRTSSGDPPYPPDANKKSFMKKTLKLLTKSSRKTSGFITFV